ncbi:MAG: serine/threonine protein kinase [Spirochaetia bacterium]
MVTGSFELLSPDLALRAVEDAHGFELDGTMESYPSYVNRVYGMRARAGERWVAKFYRPGRWTADAILDEHRFLTDCAAAEIPVVAPITGQDGRTLHVLDARENGAHESFFFAVFPRSGGRGFEPESPQALVRLGSLLGRCHAVGARGAAPHRVRCSPVPLTASYVEELLTEGLVHPDCVEEFSATCRETLAAIDPLFRSAPVQRIHGDCHRGNIIDRPGQGLALIDFDDMMSGPPVQDLWLVLPDHADRSTRELSALLEGYERFHAFDRATLGLVEPLRFMRMIYFLAWRARQRNDYWFRDSFPDWGTEAFWIKETEDLKDQAAAVRHGS